MTLPWHERWTRPHLRCRRTSRNLSWGRGATPSLSTQIALVACAANKGSTEEKLLLPEEGGGLCGRGWRALSKGWKAVLHRDSTLSETLGNPFCFSRMLKSKEPSHPSLPSSCSPESPSWPTWSLLINRAGRAKTPVFPIWAPPHWPGGEGRPDQAQANYSGRQGSRALDANEPHAGASVLT